MLRLLFTTWWIMLVQGVLLVLLSFFLYAHPGGVLVGLQVMVAGLGMIALAMVKKPVTGQVREHLKDPVEELRSAG